MISAKAKWLKIILNRYILVLVVFGVWMLFFDENNAIRQVRACRDLHKLQAEKKYYEDKINEYNFQLKAIDNDMGFVEKYAREHYYMSKPNEDVFVVLPDTIK